MLARLDRIIIVKISCLKTWTDLGRWVLYWQYDRTWWWCGGSRSRVRITATNASMTPRLTQPFRDTS